MIGLVLILATHDVIASNCRGEYHVGVAPERVAVICSTISASYHAPMKIAPGPVTITVNGSTYRNCNWAAIDGYYDPASDLGVSIVVTCPPQPLP
jgi:hypothetical protein